MIDQVVNIIQNQYALSKINIENSELKHGKIKAFKIGDDGYLSLIKVDSLFQKEEMAVLVPVFKDAPVLKIISNNDFLMIDLLDVCIEKGRKYLRFESLLKSYASLKDSKGMVDEYRILGSLAKKIKDDEKEKIINEYLDLYLETLEDAPICDSKKKRSLLIEYGNLAGKYKELSLFEKNKGLEFIHKYVYFGIDTSIVNFDDDKRIRNLLNIVLENPDAQYLLVFKGRATPCTFGEYYEFAESDGSKYMSISFWDGDSGNLFDICYKLVPEKVYVDGKLVENF